MLSFRPTSKVTFHGLRFSSEFDSNNKTTVIRWNTDTGLVMDKSEMEALAFLNNGKNISESAKLSGKTLKQIYTLLKTADSVGFIKAIDGNENPDITQKIHPWLKNIRKGYFSWLLSPLIVIPSLIIMFGGIVIMILNPNYFPTPLAFFWSKNVLIDAISVIVINYILIFIHEIAHFITTKAVGGQAKMQINYHLADVVVETEQYHMSVLPKSSRFITYISGMFIDCLIVFTIFWIYKISEYFQFELGVVKSLFQVVILLQLIAIVWEFGTFLITDVYYFISEFLGDEDINIDSKKYYFRRFSKIKSMLFTSPGFILKRNLIGRTDYLIYLLASIFGYLGKTMMFIFVSIPKHILFTLGAILYFYVSITEKDSMGILLSLITFLLVNDRIIVLLFLRKKHV